MCQLEDVILDVTYQKDDNIFYFNIDIDLFTNWYGIDVIDVVIYHIAIKTLN